MQNSLQDANVKNNQTLHIQNSAQGTVLTKKILQNPFKTVRAALKYQRIVQNTFKTVHNTLT